MSWSRSAAICRHEFRLLRADAASLLSLVLMPLIMIAFLRPLARLALNDDHPGANGSEFTVPAMATMFAFFLVAMIGFSFLNERQLGTWERLRASQATSAEILVGKVIPAFALAVFQQTALFSLGFAIFGLRAKGSVIGLALVVLALCVCLTSMGVLIAAIFKSNQQLNAFANIMTMVLAGVSGAFVPIDLLPSWARTIAPISPQYWALRGYRSVILDGEGLGSVLLPIGVLLLFGAVCGVLAAMRLRFDEDTARADALPGDAPTAAAV
jgi:ABC-2 type transport system permease protein